MGTISSESEKKGVESGTSVVDTPPPVGRMALDAFQGLQTGVLICDSAGIVRMANPAAHSLLDREGPITVGTQLSDLLASLESLEQGIAAGRPEIIFERARGRSVLGYELSTLEGGGRVVAFRDMTEHERLRADRDRLRQVATVDEVLPTVLHELRNPLAAVTSAVEVLVEERENRGDVELTEALNTILAELRRMSLVFQGIGSVGRRLRADRPAAIDRATEEVVRIMSRRAEQSGMTITRDLAALPPLPLDPVVFKAIVFNLLNNAIYACTRGGRIDVRLRLLPGPRLLLQVSDDGEGMSPAVLASCTRPFFTTRPNGSGLGLVLCREAVEQAGGFLAIDSAPKRGTVVQIGLPLPASR